MGRRFVTNSGDFKPAANLVKTYFQQHAEMRLMGTNHVSEASVETLKAHGEREYQT
jgi:hypothetical protein